MTTDAAWDDLSWPARAGGLGLVPAWGVLGDLLAVFIRSARDTFSKEGGDPIDWLYATDPIELLGGKPIWLQRSKSRGGGRRFCRLTTSPSSGGGGRDLMTPEDAERELGRFFAHGLLEFQRVGVHELVEAIAQLIEGEPFLCPPPAAAAYVARLLAAIDPDFPPEVIPLLEEHDPPARHCPHCAAEEGRILAALEWEGS